MNEVLSKLCPYTSAKKEKITLVAKPSEVAKLNLRIFLQISTGM